MGLETGTYISDLNTANPGASDPKSQGDDHLRLIKSALKSTFPNINDAVTATPAELNALVGIGSALAGVSDTATLSNKTLSGAVLNDGYTEEVYAVSGTTPALSPTNGSIQTWTLSGNSTPTAGTWAAGQSLTLMVDDGSAYTVTWTSLPVTWKTNNGLAPTLNTSGYTAIVLWKVGTTIYGARVGDA